jgi:hypothetical protein
LIRRQIKSCYLFVPIISANKQSREEGYFRREWILDPLRNEPRFQAIERALKFPD